MSDDTAPEIIYPVARQLDAYTARDLDAFMLWWADDCQYYAFPDTLLANGAEEIRARHITRFLEPHLFGKLLSRVTVGNMVVDYETVRRTFDQGPGELEVICMY